MEEAMRLMAEATLKAATDPETGGWVQFYVSWFFFFCIDGETGGWMLHSVLSRMCVSDRLYSLWH